MTTNIGVASLLLLTVALSGQARADIVVGFTNGPNMARYSDNGQFIRGFTVYEGGYLGESMGQPVLGPDGFIYVLGNDLGHATIERFNVDTGLATDGNPFTSFSGTDKIPNYAAGAGPAFGPTGDLFVTDSGFLTGAQRLLRIDGTDGLLRAETGVNDPTDPARDILAKPLNVPSPLFDTEVLLTKQGGRIQRYLSNRPPVGPSAITFVETIETGVPGIGEMELGPDGLLYIVDATSRSVIRYDLTAKSVVDTFVPTVPVVPGSSGAADFVGSMRFTPDGDLLLLSSGLGGLSNMTSFAEIRRYDGSTGQFEGVQFTVPPQQFGFANGIEYLPIPEPSSAVLAVSAAAAATMILRQRRQRGKNVRRA